jgi:hypothetical protein
MAIDISEPQAACLACAYTRQLFNYEQQIRKYRAGELLIAVIWARGQGWQPSFTMRI